MGAAKTALLELSARIEDEIDAAVKELVGINAEVDEISKKRSDIAIGIGLSGRRMEGMEDEERRSEIRSSIYGMHRRIEELDMLAEEKAETLDIRDSSTGLTRFELIKKLSDSSVMLRKNAGELMLGVGDYKGAFGLAKSATELYGLSNGFRMANPALEQRNMGSMVASGARLAEHFADIVIGRKGRIAIWEGGIEGQSGEVLQAAVEGCMHAAVNLEGFAFESSDENSQEAGLAFRLTTKAARMAMANGDFGKRDHILRGASVRYGHKGFTEKATALLEVGRRMVDEEETETLAKLHHGSLGSGVNDL